MRNNLKHLGLVGLGLLACLSGYSVACSSSDTNNGNSSSSSSTGGASSSSSSSSSSGSTDTDGGSSGDGGNEAGTSSGTLGPATALHKVTGLGGDERVSGIWCEPGATTCVLSAIGLSDEEPSHISSFTSTTVSATPLVQASDANSTTIGMLGDLKLLSFNKVGTTLIANLDTGAQGFIFASGDPTVAANWHVQKIGDTTPTTGGFGLNHEYAFGYDATTQTWVQMREGQGVYSTTGATITATSAWTDLWEPGATPEIPADLEDQKAADATICNDPVSYSVSPTPVQAGYISADASLIVYPVGSVNEDDDPDGPGLCISTDLGKHFHVSKLTAVATAGFDGPTAVTCTSKTHCVAGGGQVFSAGSSYIYYTNNASSGATSTWTKATIPASAATGDNVLLNSFFFAPDGMHGWVVGSSTGTDALLWTTTDGGATWTDATASISGLGDPSILFSGFAADATHYIIGGRTGLLYSTF